MDEVSRAMAAGRPIYYGHGTDPALYTPLFATQDEVYVGYTADDGFTYVARYCNDGAEYYEYDFVDWFNDYDRAAMHPYCTCSTAAGTANKEATPILG